MAAEKVRAARLENSYVLGAHEAVLANVADDLICVTEARTQGHEYLAAKQRVGNAIVRGDIMGAKPVQGLARQHGRGAVKAYQM